MLRRAARWCCVLTLLAVIAWPTASGEEEKKEQPLPLKRVVLFSSSVGFFERGAIPSLVLLMVAAPALFLFMDRE